MRVAHSSVDRLLRQDVLLGQGWSGRCRVRATGGAIAAYWPISYGRDRNVPIPTKIVFLENDRLNSCDSFRCFVDYPEIAE